MSDTRANPYKDPHTGKWHWIDETGDISRPHPSQASALKELAGYLHYLDHGPTPWQKVWWPVRYTWWPTFMRMMKS